MAYDKAVDSSKLDAALTATAERIREKSGSSAQLNWDETTGFAEDIGSLTDDLENTLDEAIGVSAGVLPAGYTQVEYIQSSGTQYIDTGVIPNQDTRVVLDVIFTNEVASWLFGSRTSASVNCFGMLNTGELQYRADYNTTTADLGSQITDRFVLDMNKNVISFDGETVHTFTYASFQGVYSMLLFGANTENGASVSDSAVIIIYSCQIYDNGTLVRDFVPCVNSSEIAGLYDLVNNVFYADEAGGTFEVGGTIITKNGLGILASIDCLEAVCTNISEALAEKGVDAPDDMALSEVSDLIGQISGAQIATGTVTLSSTTVKTVTVDELDFTPTRVIIMSTKVPGEGGFSSNASTQTVYSYDTEISHGLGISRYSGSYYAYYQNVTNIMTFSIIDGGFTITATLSTSYLPRYFQYTAIG